VLLLLLALRQALLMGSQVLQQAALQEVDRVVVLLQWAKSARRIGAAGQAAAP
jgi:hypothetical protein